MYQFLQFDCGKTPHQDYQSLKQRLQEIIMTFQQEREQYERAYSQREQLYLDEIEQKQHKIYELRELLSKSNEELSIKQTQVNRYQQIIALLKEQFFKIDQIVTQIDDTPLTQHTLQKVKSDFNLTKLQHKQHKQTPSHKFDINAYFQKVKSVSSFSSEKKLPLDKLTVPTTLDDTKSKKSQKSVGKVSFKGVKENIWGSGSASGWSKSGKKWQQLNSLLRGTNGLTTH